MSRPRVHWTVKFWDFADDNGAFLVMGLFFGGVFLACGILIVMGGSS